MSMYQRPTGSLALGPGSTPFAGPEPGTYSAGLLPDNSEETVVGRTPGADGELKVRDAALTRIQR